jgi:1,4-dihydroxy-6-naphthoate synthase
MELNLGISPCPNDIFIFSGLILNEVQIENISLKIQYLDIETLNLQAQLGALDVVKISYANYPRCKKDYQLLTAGGALGRGVGPLLLSNGGQWRQDQEVAVPGLYTTANFLLDFWARHQLKKRFIQFDHLYQHLCQTPDSQGVVIHEKRFTYAADGLTLIQDLGTHWEHQTGFPIPLGALAAKHSLSAEDLTSAVQRSLQWAYANHDRAFALCQQYSADLSAEVIQGHIKLYVNDFSMDLGSEGRKAVEFFFDQQKESDCEENLSSIASI